MKLHTLLEANFSDLSCDVLGIQFDSRLVKKGDLFFAIPSASKKKHDELQYVYQALRQGAVALMCEKQFFDKLNKSKINKIKVPTIVVDNVRQALALCAARFYGNPSRAFYLAGITGTNGKTTLTTLLEHVWRNDAKNVGVIGTINHRFFSRSDSNGQKILPSSHTTPDALYLQDLMATMKEELVSHVAMEVSAHGLDQDRVEALDFDAAVYTNLTQDHLDYFNSLKDYSSAKQKFFTDVLVCSKKKNKIAVLCDVIPHLDELRQILQAQGIQVVTYGLKTTSDVYATDIQTNLMGSTFRIKGSGFDCKISSRLIGHFNIENMLAAFVVAHHAGGSIQDICASLSRFNGVNGRLERLEDHLQRLIYVDYAHTPDALEKVLVTLKKLGAKKIITVFGCGGDRDRLKRPLMGKIASRYSTKVILTNDNPRTEKPDLIVQEIIEGFKSQRKNNYLVCLDRKAAIKKGLSLTRANEVLLIAGKGHEDYQIIGTRTEKFSDQDTVRQLQ